MRMCCSPGTRDQNDIIAPALPPWPKRMYDRYRQIAVQLIGVGLAQLAENKEDACTGSPRQ